MGFLNATEAEFDALYRIHVKGVFFLSQKLLPLLADGGRIVNISSGLTRIVMANRAPYADHEICGGNPDPLYGV